MTTKTYSTDTLCPNCGFDVYHSLAEHVYSEGGGDFEAQCPQCESILEVTFEPVPAFGVKLLPDEAAPFAIEEEQHANPAPAITV